MNVPKKETCFSIWRSPLLGTGQNLKQPISICILASWEPQQLNRYKITPANTMKFDVSVLRNKHYWQEGGGGGGMVLPLSVSFFLVSRHDLSTPI